MGYYGKNDSTGMQIFQLLKTGSGYKRRLLWAEEMIRDKASKIVRITLGLRN